MSDLRLVGEPARVSPFDSIKQVREDGSEYWSARDLMSAVHYDQWRNFEGAVIKARASCAAQGFNENHHFADASKVIEGGRWGAQTVQDFHLSRFAAYLVVMNGDPRKPEIAAAQGYFAVKTREAETAPKQLSGPALYLAAIEQATAEIATLEAKNAELTPKAEAFDGYIGAEGDYSINATAKLLQRRGIETGQNRLANQLLEWGWLYRGEKRILRAKQSQIVTGRLAEKTYYFVDEITGERRAGSTSVRITPKGVDAIHSKLSKELVS